MSGNKYHMSHTISTTIIDDLDHVAVSIDDLRTPWSCLITTFKCNYANDCFRMAAAHTNEKLVGFAAWVPSYTLHHCVYGVLFIVSLLLGCN